MKHIAEIIRENAVYVLMIRITEKQLILSRVKSVMQTKKYIFLDRTVKAKTTNKTS